MNEDRKTPVYDSLNLMQQKLLVNYAKGMKQMDAAIAAGYSAKTASQAACRFLKTEKARAAYHEISGHSDMIASLRECQEILSQWVRNKDVQEPDLSMIKRHKAMETLLRTRGELDPQVTTGNTNATVTLDVLLREKESNES